MSRPVSPAALREQLETFLRKEKHQDALAVYVQLEREEPKEPRWPHRKGDLLLRLKRSAEAIESYEKTVDLYAQQGFVARAAAMAKVILGIDPARTDVLSRVDPSPARDLRGQQTPRDRGLSLVHEQLPELALEPPEPPPAPPQAPATRPSIVLDAPLLELDEEAADDEIRFIEVEDDDAITISVTELDVDEQPRDFVEDEPAPEALAKMPSVPLFADVPQAALERMLAEAELVDVPDGGILVRSGEPADALYVLAEGRAEVLVPGVDAGVPLVEGEIVGETCLLPDVRRRADVVARGPLRTLRLPRAALDRLIAEYAQIGDVLYELLTKRLVANLLRTSELFAAFDPGTRTELASLFEVRRATPGTAILQAGKRSDGLYVPLLGQLEATLADGRTVVVPLGQMLGEQGLLARTPSGVTVLATTDVLVLRLSGMRFTELAATLPSVLEHLAELAARGGFEDHIGDVAERLV